MALQIVFDNARVAVVGGPQMTIRGQVEEIDRGMLVQRPLIEKFAVFVKHLNAVIGPVDYVDMACHGIGGNAMHHVELARARFVGRIALLSPGQKKFAILVKISPSLHADSEKPIRVLHHRK